MMKKYSKKFWTIFASISFVSYGIIWACAGGDWGIEYDSNFEPKVFIDSTERYFAYSDLYYSEIGYDDNHKRRFNKEIVNEWSEYFEGKFPKEEINHFLLSASVEVCNEMAKDLAKRDASVISKEIAYKMSLDTKDKKLKAFFTYLKEAKAAEIYAAHDSYNYWWSEEEKEAAEKQYLSEAEIAFTQSKFWQKSLSTIKDKFLIQRYYFQLVRSLFFARKYDDCIAKFNEFEKKTTSGNMYYRAMTYAAGAYAKNNNSSMANYMYSKVFTYNNNLKTVAHYSFHPQDENDWNKTLALAKNNEEKIILWQMLGINYQDEFRSMQEIYKLNPKSDKLDLLVTRYVNKMEREINVTKTNVSDVVAFLKQNSKNSNKPYLWEVSAGYLSNMISQYKDATEFYTQANKLAPNDNLTKSQIRLLNLLNNIEALNKITEKDENNLLADLEWFFDVARKDSKLRTIRATSFIIKTLNEKYAKQGDWLKAECFITNSAVYVDNKKLQALKAFCQNTNKKPFEKFCESMYSLNLTALKHFEMIQFTFNENLDEAIAIGETLTWNPENNLEVNPFNGNIKDCHDCDYNPNKRSSYNPLTLVKKMKEMKSKLSTDTYNNALLLGNAYYSISTFGSEHEFSSCGVMGYNFNVYSVDSNFRSILLNTKLPRKYYQMALLAAKTDEQKAKCHYLLAKCDRNDWYLAQFVNKPSGYYDPYFSNSESDFIAWDNFKKLQSFTKTKYYLEVLKECGYFATYIAHRK